MNGTPNANKYKKVKKKGLIIEAAPTTNIPVVEISLKFIVLELKESIVSESKESIVLELK
jgi:hypothetical protein